MAEIRCPADVSPDCPGHGTWERLTSCLDEALYHHVDVSTGHVDQVGWWVGLAIQDEAETVDLADGVPVTIPAGTYRLYRETEAGHVYVTAYDTAEDAQHAFDTWESAYGDWCHGEDMREARIVSSTGRTGR